MKKLFSVMIILVSLCTSLYAADDTEYITIRRDAQTSNAKANTEFFDVLPNFIGSSLTVYVSDIDTVVRCKLINVYKDGIVVKSIFGQVLFISKKSISYLEIKNVDESAF